MMLVEGEEAGFVHEIEDNQPMEEENGSSEPHVDSVSGIHMCQSKYAKKLCIFDMAYKVKQMETYDIGGTYTGTEPDLWFYYSTSICPGYNYLLNLFVCHRKLGNFSIGVSKSSELLHKKKSNETFLPDSLTWFTFRSAQKNENYHIKTYRFTEEDLKGLENQTVCIPINIDINSSHALNIDVIKAIKLQHDFGNLLTKQEKTDFILESASRKQFQAHKIILAAHSPILRTMIKNATSNLEFIDISDTDMELLLQFIYTGTIKDLLKQDCLKLLEIANRFQLKNLFALTQLAISEQIDVDNAVEVAIISEKYKLEELQITVFEFIKNNLAVLDTDGWKNLNDVNLTKKLFQYMHKNRTPRD